jgi:hypothetical protein
MTVFLVCVGGLVLLTAAVIASSIARKDGRS